MRIGKASGAFNQLNNVRKNKNINITKKVLKICVVALLTILTQYGCEVWSTTKVQMSGLEIIHQYCLRMILRVRWFNRVGNEVLNRA